ncbi:MAG: hypothetical protein Q4P25_04240, partial [Tissierellia bacterium]|nr:hypothetical protein [Tissierellia bacterium]
MNRQVSYRCDLLNNNDLKIGTVDFVRGTINCKANSKIKKSGSFMIKDRGDIDYLNDRIKPYMIIDGVEYPLGIYIISGKSREKK